MYPISTVKVLNNRLTVIGFSRSAEATGLFIPELDLMLDAGLIVTMTKFRRLFVTHSHGDHSFQIPFMYSPSSPAPLDIYVPQLSLSFFEQFLTSAQLLNDHDAEKALSNCQRRFTLHGVSPEEIIDLDKTYRVEILRCHHTVPSVGYAFYEKRTKLKSEFSQCKGEEIRQLRKDGVTISEEVDVSLCAVVGDTTPTVFDRESHSGQVLLERMPLVICECTFLDGEQSDDKGHTHWSGLRPIVVAHPQITFLLIHFSMKHKREEIRQFFEAENLPNVKIFL